MCCDPRFIVLTIQKVCRLDFLQVPRGRCGKTLLHQAKQVESLNAKKSTLSSGVHFIT